MRIGSVSALALAAFALSACTGAGGLAPGMDTLNIIPPCSLTDPCPQPDDDDDPAPSQPTTPVVDPDDPDNTNTGNPTNLQSGDMTLVLENGILKSPTGGSLSDLTQTAGTPNTARIQIDTKTGNNNAWPVPKTIKEYVYGTDASGGIGLGATYKEYRVVNDTKSDEVLQVWSWGNSYATQYREEAGGGNARRQAWSFGGEREAMPTGGTADYNGTFGATATSSNWVEAGNPGQTLKTNNVWRVEGDSNIHADFDNRQLTGTLSANTWMARQDNQAWLAVDVADGFADPNFAGFMDDDVVLQGQISGDNASGTAELDPALGWVNGQNPMYAGFFGPQGAGHEVAGTYNFLAQSPDPIGGDLPHNDPAKGFVQQSGVFHGCNPSCPPPTPQWV